LLVAWCCDCGDDVIGSYDTGNDDVIGSYDTGDDAAKRPAPGTLMSSAYRCGPVITSSC